MAGLSRIYSYKLNTAILQTQCQHAKALARNGNGAIQTQQREAILPVASLEFDHFQMEVWQQEETFRIYF